MHLKRIELRSFKSFSEKTVLHLDSGLNVITGPNGTGKSNILDAVRFVLGETSTRALRADRLSSLVSDDRQGKTQRSYVRIVIDNSDRKIPIEEDEIGITRYIEEKGETVYYLNKKRVPRLVVTNTLNLAGLYSKGYNIVMQGEISRIADKDSVEIRTIIEEAIGLSSYDEKRKQAEEELRQADINVRVAYSKLEEVKARLEQLELEMNRALSNSALRGLSEEAKRHLVLEDTVEKRRKIEDLEHKLSEAAAEVTQAQTTYQTTLDNHRNAVEGLMKLNQEMQRASIPDASAVIARISQMRGDIGAVALKISRAEDRIASMAAELEICREHRSSASRAIHRRRGMLKNASMHLERVRRTKDKLERSLAVLSTSLENALENAEKIEKAKEIALSDMEEASGLASSLQSERQKILSETESLSSEGENLQRIILLNATRLSAWKKRISRLEKQLLLQTDSLNSIEAQLLGNLGEISDIEGRSRQVEESLGQIERLMERLKGRMDALSIVPSEAPEEACRIMREAGVDVKGRLKEVISYPPEIERVVRAVLGDWLESIVVSKEEDPILIAVAFRRLGMIGIKIVGETDYLDKSACETRPEGLLLSEALTFPREMAQFISEKTKDFVIVDDVSQAPPLVQKGWNVVTRDGVVLSDDRTAKLQNDEDQRLLELEIAISDLEKDFISLENFRQETVQTRAISLAEATEQIRQSIRGIRRNRSSTSVLLAEFRAKLDHSHQLLKLMQNQGLKVRQKYSNSRARIRAIERRLKLVRRILTCAKARMDGLEAGLVKKKTKIDCLQNKVNKVKKSLRQQEKSEGPLRQATEIGERKLQSLILERGNQRNHIHQKVGELASILKAVSSLKAGRDEMERELRGFEAERLKDLSRPPDQREENRNSLSEEIRRLQSQIDEADEVRRSSEQKAREIEIKVNIGRSELAILESKMAELGRPLVEFDMPSPVSRRCMSRLADLCDSALKQVGEVNMLAGRQYLEQAGNYRLVSERMNKLDEERKAILDLISEIETKKKESFLNALNSVSASFSEYFRKVTGGSAWLEIENLEEPFQGGITVMVQFPNKGPRVVYGCSGGEKSVVALCFIFALQELKPAPFYFFDEIDAHLDPINIQNYGKLLSMKASGSQLIVISLKDVIANRGNKIIGTYMRSGRSRLVEMPLQLQRKSPS